MSRTVLAGAVAMSVAAITSFVVVLFAGGRETVPAALSAGLEEAGRDRRAIANDVAGLADAFGRLDERLDTIDGRIAELLARSGEPTTPTGAGAGSEAGQVADERALERLDALVSRLEALSAGQPVTGARFGAPQAESPEESQAIVEEMQAVAIDPTPVPQERLQALRELRARDGRSREVTLAMIELVESPDIAPRLRADIVRNLHGVEFAELKAPLLRILESDPHTETKSETIESLEPFYGDADVRAAVERVRDSDPDPRLR
ncbi:MAG TPA: hypothetical protein VK116_12845, partial [Planctomycetota bacterium]|nr:hypothetical protein [Planctomycetota bacterium]